MVADLPDLGAVAAALLLLLIAAALWVLIQLLVNSLGKAPVIGSWISSTLAGWLNDARNAVLSASADSWHAAVDLFNWVIEATTKPVVLLWHFMDSASQAIQRIVLIRLPEWAATAASYALGLYQSALSYAQQLEAQAVAFAASEASAVESTVSSWVTSALTYAAALAARAESYALALVQAAETDAANAIVAASSTLQAEISSEVTSVQADIQQVEAWTAAGLAQLGADLTSGLASAEALAFAQVQALQQGIVTDLEQTGEAALQLAWPDAIPDIGALRQALGADFPDIQALLGLLAGAGTAGLLHALISSLAGTQAITKLATDCIVPNCRNLSSLGSFLQQLFADATDLALIAWLAEGVADPGRWAADTDALLGSIATDTASAARTLLGV